MLVAFNRSEPHYSVPRTVFAGQDALAQDNLAAEVVDKHLET